MRGLNSININIEGTDITYNTLEDWGLYITNGNYIGNPQEQTSFIEIKGRNGLLDISEALTGYRSYSKREIKVELSGIRDHDKWESVISDFRNKIEGKIVRLVFKNELNYFWRGRCHIENFDKAMKVGKFVLSLPNADPFKYSVQTFNENWLWDPFSFDDGITTKEIVREINNEAIQVILPAGKMPVVPTVTVYSANNLRMQKLNESGQTTGRIYQLSVGDNELFSTMVNGPDNVRLYFWGTGKFAVNFRGASL